MKYDNVTEWLSNIVNENEAPSITLERETVSQLLHELEELEFHSYQNSLRRESLQEIYYLLDIDYDVEEALNVVLASMHDSIRKDNISKDNYFRSKEWKNNRKIEQLKKENGLLHDKVLLYEQINEELNSIGECLQWALHPYKDTYEKNKVIAQVILDLKGVKNILGGD